MSETITYPPIDLAAYESPLSKFELERRAFWQLLPFLLPSFRGLYVAIHNEQVVDSGDNDRDLADRVWAKYGYVPIYVELVTEQPLPVMRMRHYRVIK